MRKVYFYWYSACTIIDNIGRWKMSRTFDTIEEALKDREEFQSNYYSYEFSPVQEGYV